ncbi:MAG: PorV/PorQ family protein, partial [Candidatus Kryptoniota bacterium]
MKKEILITAALLLNGASYAQFKTVATTGFTFLEIPVTARYSAVGEVGLTLSNAGAEALFTNPSMLAFSTGKQYALVSFGNYLAQTQQEAAGYAVDFGDLGIVGVSVYRLDEGTMTRTVNADPNNPGGGYKVIGSFSASDIAVGLSYIRKLTDHFSFGGTIKYVQEGIAEFKASNELIDFGMVYFTGFKSLRIAGSIQNLGVNTRFSGPLESGGTLTGDNFSMPVTFRLGAAMELLGDYESPTRFTLSFEGLHPSDYSERINIGAEYWYLNMVALR